MYEPPKTGAMAEFKQMVTFINKGKDNITLFKLGPKDETGKRTNVKLITLKPGEKSAAVEIGVAEAVIAEDDDKKLHRFE